jgi:hypothetical protein
MSSPLGVWRSDHQGGHRVWANHASAQFATLLLELAASAVQENFRARFNRVCNAASDGLSKSIRVQRASRRVTHFFPRKQHVYTQAGRAPVRRGESRAVCFLVRS